MKKNSIIAITVLAAAATAFAVGVVLELKKIKKATAEVDTTEPEEFFDEKEPLSDEAGEAPDEAAE